MNAKPKISKPMIMMLLALGLLFGLIFAYKLFSNIMMKRFFASQENPTVTVSTMKVNFAPWQPTVKASGSARAVRGVFVTAQLAGMIQTIYLTPGALVEEGTILVQQNADPDIAQLHALEANAELARITYNRDKAQYKIMAVSKQQVDSDEQNWKSLQAKSLASGLALTKTITAV